ncbi:leucine-rich repeat protein, partial [Prevotella sp. P6B4]|uniref:leucine-rich repeat protein n=1 Tax=Prevotella sp. P6B4 TaxID=1410614 RepID=UPI0012DE5B15
CSGLTSLDLSGFKTDNVTKMSYLFSGCSGLTSLDLSGFKADKVSDMSGIFSRCSGLTSITFPQNMTSIGDYAFYYCSSLTSITIPNSVTSIGDYAFNGCSGLASVAILNPSPVAITQFVFSNSVNATLYVLAGSKAKYKAASYWKDFEEIVEKYVFFADDNVRAICVEHWDTDHDGGIDLDEAAAVTTLSEFFKGNTSITSFNELAYFTSVTSIADNAFNGCEGLTSVTIPNSMTSIGGKAFYGCRSLTSITIPNSVTSIGYYAFWGCSGLTSITIPSSVMTIGNYSFSACSGLTSIEVESENSKYDSRDNCNAIIETATNRLIAGCRITTIPNGVTTIGNGAFVGIGYCTSITIPNSVTTIGDYAFYYCRSFTSITIPNSVTSIGSYAFDSCSRLTSITIPGSVTSIGERAFNDCSGLTSVTIMNPLPVTITQFVFSNSANATLYVPAGSKAKYKAANYWTDFKNIVEKYIYFADDNLKTICVEHWDTDHDGEISLVEAAKVTTLSTYFKFNASITSFNELAYFTSVTSIGYSAFNGCEGLTSVTIPNSVTSIG